MRQGLLSAFNTQEALRKRFQNEGINRNVGKPGSVPTQELFVDGLSRDHGFLNRLLPRGQTGQNQKSALVF